MKILVINGPNINMLGVRETAVYGRLVWSQIEDKLKRLADEQGIDIQIVQSNHEGALIDTIQDAPGKGFQGILINPAGYGHTSIALRDALLAVNLPFIEVHISNIFAREEFRHKTYISDIAKGVVVGLGADSYLLGLRGLKDILSHKP
ncbi:MAG: type II 3-dehydroquinate dehydratase [Candidatus Obscuribacterales bacterium]|nr:type II 3-dehydroquinate dehydratase [Candidatus Obscuribacterales bacterium]